MKLKSAEFEINPEKPFQNDALNLEESAKALTELLKSSAEESLVLSINAEWGNGKTTFLKMWEQSLKNEKFNTLYFSAWENDFTDNALISLIGELQSKITELSNIENSKIKDSLENIKKWSKKLSKKAFPVALKIATMGVIDLDEKQIEKALADFSEKIAEEQLKDYENAKNTIKGFKETLETLVKELNKNKEDEQPYPLVIFIDELDRCRPLYAIELLEKIKHIFNISGIVFVLAIDKKQLGYSICSVYGQGFNVEGYLRRFIDLDYNLPQSNPKNINIFIKQQVERFNLTEVCNQNETVKNIIEYFEFLILVFEPSLRNQETFFKQLSAVIKITPKKDLNVPLLALLIVLKIEKPSLYENFVNNKEENQYELIDFFAKCSLDSVYNPNYKSSFSLYITNIFIEIITCKINYYQNNEDALGEMKKIVSMLPEHQRIKIKSFFDTREGRDILLFKYHDILEQTVKKIDIASHFS